MAAGEGGKEDEASLRAARGMSPGKGRGEDAGEDEDAGDSTPSARKPSSGHRGRE